MILAIDKSGTALGLCELIVKAVSITLMRPHEKMKCRESFEIHAGTVLCRFEPRPNGKRHVIESKVLSCQALTKTLLVMPHILTQVESCQTNPDPGCCGAEFGSRTKITWHLLGRSRRFVRSMFSVWSWVGYSYTEVCHFRGGCAMRNML